MSVMPHTRNTPDHRMHAESKKRRPSFLAAPLFTGGDASR
jgi:hypothetical protein